MNFYFGYADDDYEPTHLIDCHTWQQAVQSVRDCLAQERDVHPDFIDVGKAGLFVDAWGNANEPPSTVELGPLRTRRRSA